MVLGIYGASGAGKMVLRVVDAINRLSVRFNKIVFIDDDDSINSFCGYDVLNFDEVKAKYEPSQIEIHIAMGNPKVRKLLYEKVTNHGFELATIIHPDIFIHDSMRIGKGVFIDSFTSLDYDIEIKDNVTIYNLSSIGHDTVIGAHSVISPGCVIGGWCNLGVGTFTGQNSSIRQLTTIPDWTTVGMGAAIVKSIEESGVYLGVPAKKRNI